MATKNERAATEALMDRLKLHLGGCEVLKHCDVFTSGIPDLSVSWRQATTWIEDKILDPTQTVLSPGKLTMVQLLQCVALERTTSRCWVVAFQRGGKGDPGSTYIYRPSFIYRHRDEPGALVIDRVSPHDLNVADLWRDGVVRFEKFHYNAVVQLIRATH